MNDRTNMTLDEAMERFQEELLNKTKSAGDLLITALTYWNDDIISDETFGHIVGMVGRDLLEIGK